MRPLVIATLLFLMAGCGKVIHEARSPVNLAHIPTEISQF
jgi:hypothetical protein